MGKNKLSRFEELLHMERIIQPEFDEVFHKDHELKGRWANTVFQNQNPIVLELGCGKGEYTTGLARKFPHINFIGVDIKGARLWRGVKQINEENIRNAAFLRTRIEFINAFFGKDEVSEIWLTFPDPQLKTRRQKKRLSSHLFLSMYQKFLLDKGIIHLKTDNTELYQFTHRLAEFNNLEILISTDKLYESGLANEIHGIRTFYESQYLARGIPIKYLKFRLDNQKTLYELPESEE